MSPPHLGVNSISARAQNTQGQINFQRKRKLAVTDLMMPVMDGPATIRALQRLNPQIKIIAVSGLAGNGRMLEAAQAGVKSFLPKPYAADRLLKAIAEALKV